MIRSRTSIAIKDGVDTWKMPAASLRTTNPATVLEHVGTVSRRFVCVCVGKRLAHLPCKESSGKNAVPGNMDENETVGVYLAAGIEHD